MSRYQKKPGAILFIFLFPVLLFNQELGIRLQNLDVSNGLSASNVNIIYQDSRGYIWFGTNDGLNRYDGYEIRVYKYDPDNSNSIADNYIRCLLEDQNHQLWIGTDAGGLIKFDLEREEFKKISLETTGTKNRQKPQIWDLTIDQNNVLWIATWDGVFSIDLSREKITAKRILKKKYKTRCLVTIQNENEIWFGTEDEGLFRIHTTKIGNAIAERLTDKIRIYSLLSGGDRTVWLGTRKGLLKYDPSEKKTVRIPLLNGSSSFDVTSLTFGPENNLWIATIDQGLISLNLSTKSVNRFRSTEDDSYGLSRSGILNLFIDQHKTMWIATRGNGVQYFNPLAPFRFYGHQPDAERTLSDPSIRAIYSDENTLWVGGYGGLDQFSKQGSKDLHFDGEGRGLTNRNIYALAKDFQETLWVGTEGGGLFKKPTGKNTFEQVIIDASNTPEADHVYELFFGRDSSLYLGTRGGLYVFNRKKNSQKAQKINLLKKPAPALDAEDVMAITEGKNGTLYVGTGSAGLFILDSLHKLQKQYTHNPENRGSISSNRVKALHLDSNGSLWVGTGGGGLDLFDKEGGRFKHFNQKNGLPDNTVYGILEDRNQNLWLSTNKGLSKFNRRNASFYNFGIEHGLQNLEFNTGAYFQAQSGEMFFGGINGLNAFFPEKVKTKHPPPTVILTDFRITNRPVSASSDGMSKEINALESITLSYKDVLVSFSFSGLNYLAPRKTQYRYRMTGVDDDWVYTGTDSRTATYTHLPAGNLELLIQAAASVEQDFGPTKRLHLQVQPAPWQSWWARLLYGLFALFGLYLIRQNEIKKMTLRTELAQQIQEAAALNEIDTLKSRLISNVSHELRTPLTLLVGHIEKLAKTIETNNKSESKKNIAAAWTSLDRVTRLSDQLFDLSRFAAGKVKLRAKEENLSKVISQLVNEFRFECERHDLQLVFKHETEQLDVFLDKPKIEQVLLNLLSNAVKFSTKGTNITIELLENSPHPESGTGDFVVIRITNIGKGIPEHAAPNVFERLYQVEIDGSLQKGGAGIGLALVKELVELHGGAISVQSAPGGETQFEFTLPKGKAHLNSNEIIVEVASDQELESERVFSDPTLTKILLVEDDDELREFISKGLSEEFILSQAENGELGFLSAQSWLPDLIISDVNMPVKNGLELLKAIRNDEILAHVPVILLTGQLSEEDRMKGYEASANDYITKPFKMDELKVRIKNILISREQLLERTKNQSLGNLLPDATLSKRDEQFFKKIKEIITDKISDSNLNVEMLAKEVFLGKRQLERKMKDLTGQSPAEFIRQVRLTRAQQLLLEGSFATVSEISRAVGFSNIKYFSRIFRKQFGRSPRETLKA